MADRRRHSPPPPATLPANLGCKGDRLPPRRSNPRFRPESMQSLFRRRWRLTSVLCPQTSSGRRTRPCLVVPRPIDKGTRHHRFHGSGFQVRLRPLSPSASQRSRMALPIRRRHRPGRPGVESYPLVRHASSAVGRSPAVGPGDDETRALLEARRQLRDQRDEHGERPERRVVALLPLDTDGRPDPTTRGLAYATLPTQARLPFGFHLQADWLVDLDRQNLRSVEGNAWQEAIVRQVPELVRQILVWLKTQPEQSRGRGYSTLADPTKDDGPLSEALGRLQGDFGAAISDVRSRRMAPSTGSTSSIRLRLRIPGCSRSHGPAGADDSATASSPGPGVDTQRSHAVLTPSTKQTDASRTARRSVRREARTSVLGGDRLSR